MDPFVFADVWGQPVGVVENPGEAEERDYGGEFVQDEEGGYVGDGSGAEGLEVAGEEVWEARFEAGDSGGGLRVGLVGVETGDSRW